MSHFLQRTGLATLAVLLICGGPIAAAPILERRKRLAHAQRRSPLVEDLQHSPGRSVRAKLDALDEVVVETSSLVFVFPIGMLAAAFGVGLVAGIQTLIETAPLFTLVAAGVVAYHIRKLVRTASWA